jgi:hypothetical protein
MIKYPNKGMCLRIMYKDYKVEKEDRLTFVKAYDLLKEKGDECRPEITNLKENVNTAIDQPKLIIEELRDDIKDT